MSAPGNASAPLWRRLLWFVGLWLFGVAALAAIAYALRFAILRLILGF